MDIGGALAEARSEAGMTITQVSERTRIRETIIRDIERDDYAACGGDFYARGHIRAIAKVVGTDPVPLIEEYDAAHAYRPSRATRRASKRSRSALSTNLDLSMAAAEFGLPNLLWPAGDGALDCRRSWSQAAPIGQSSARSRGRGPTAGRRRPAPRGTARQRGAQASLRPRGITAAEAFRPRLPLDFERRRPGRRRRACSCWSHSRSSAS